LRKLKPLVKKMTFKASSIEDQTSRHKKAGENFLPGASFDEKTKQTK